MKRIVKEEWLIIDFSKCKNITAIKEKLRTDLTEEFKEFLIERYGKENVSQIGVNKIATAVGEVKDDDGFLQEVCAVVSISAKPWTNSKGSRRHTEAFDRFQAEEDYQLELKAKMAKRKSNKENQ